MTHLLPRRGARVAEWRGLQNLRIVGSNPTRASFFMSKTPLYYIHTFGCQANKADSERIAGDYQARGWKEAEDWRECDELVINTCAVRQRAEDRVQGLLLNVVDFFEQEKRSRPKIILTGCMTHHGEAELMRLLPAIDQVLPINEVGFNQPAIRKDKKHAWLPISTGCNSFCSYCIVPYARGREKSRPRQEILSEAEGLIKQGYEELTLLGMNVNSWGLEKVGVSLRKKMFHQGNLDLADIPDNQSQYFRPKGIPPFVELIQELSKLSGLKKLRFYSSNPWDFHDELIDEIGRNKKIDRYIHLPVQSGSDQVLARMNRGYTRKDYLAIVKKLRAAAPKITIGTDIIVGFPGETDQEFQETVDLAKKVDWQIAFVAKYSPRPGTVSERLYEDDVSAAVKSERWWILENLINRQHLAERPKIV